ncbi:hypothetical protein BGW39_008113 [Mortierella sp. 14UC]|nr:hypothetical protein BGW39_008113 [Mortierella sp. 14UC]
MTVEKLYQSFRVQSNVMRIPARYHKESDQHVVFWEDIALPFRKDATIVVMQGSDVVTPARDSGLRRLEPLCIEYHHEEVLDLVVGDVPSPKLTFIASPPSIQRMAALDAHTTSDPSLSGSQAQKTSSSLSTAGSIFQIQSVNARALGGPSYLLPLPEINIPAHAKEHAEHNIMNLDRQSQTAVSRTRRPESVVQLDGLLQRMGSAVQLFGSLLAQGQNEQALLVKQESESIKQQMEQYYNGLESAIAENKALQMQLKEKMEDAEKMTKRILELQEAQMDNDKRMLQKLAAIQSKATAILIQTYELHEFPIPRLFIVLPKGDITSTREKIGTMFVDRFRLYFLCECGEHTRPTGGLPSALRHGIHLARHEGYDLDRPNEFFSKYGSYVLALMQVLKYGVVVAGMVVPALNTLKVAEELDYVAAGLKSVQKDFVPKVDSAIDYLQHLKRLHEGEFKDVGSAGSMATMVDSTSMSRLEGLEGADLRNLASFLKGSDKDMVLGNLFKMVTPKGHVKWVCLDHYRESYGAAALEHFKETVKEFKGTYDQQTGRVAVRLESTDQARLFYATLSSARLVHELELTLDWKTSFDDLKALKDAMHQSSISHLVLDLCDKTSSRLDVIFLSHRSEPIVHIMAIPKIHTLVLRNITSFLSPTKDLVKSTTLHVRHFDLSERIVLADDFTRLENMIRRSSALVRLAIVVADIDKALKRLRPVVAAHKTLSTLDLQLPDGTAALFQFEQGSEKIIAIGLKVVKLDPMDSMRMTTVTSIELLAKHSSLDCSQYLQSVIKQCRNLKRIRIGRLPDNGAESLQVVQQVIDEYVCHIEKTSTVTPSPASVRPAAEGQTAELFEFGSGYMELHSNHSRTVLWNMALLVASFDESKPQKEAATAADGEMKRTRSMLIARRGDGSLASVRFELEDGGSDSMVLHISDFEASEVFQHTPATKLAVIDNDGFGLLRELIQEPGTYFSSLRTLEFGARRQNLLEILQHFQQASTHYPTLTQLNLWSVNNKTVRSFSLPLQDLNLSRHDLSVVQLSSLRQLLHSASTLSRLTLSVLSFSEVFEIVSSAAQLHKQLSRVQIDQKASRLSAHFTVGSGEVRSISLRVLKSELDNLLTLSNVTKLTILDLGRVSETKSLMLSMLKHHQYLKIIIMECQPVDILESIDAVHQAVKEFSRSCQVIFKIVGSSVKQTVLFPLNSLVIPSDIVVKDSTVNFLQRLFQTSPELQELRLSTSLVAVAQKIFDFIVQERRPMATLSLQLQKGPMAVFSLENGETGDNLAVAQRIAYAELSKTFFLPSVKLDRIDVVGSQINKSQAAEIVLSVLYYRHEFHPFRFPDYSGRVEDVAIAIKDFLRRGSHSPVRQEEDGTISSNDSTVKAFGLAVFSVLGHDTRERLSSVLWTGRSGVLEAIDLDCNEPDGVTLKLNPVAFDKSTIAQLADVTNLRVSIGRGSTLIEDFVREPLRTFSKLKHLELSCEHSLQSGVLLTALEEAGRHPTLKQFHMRSPGKSLELHSYDFPIKTLDLTQYTIHPHDLRVLEIIPACNLSLSSLTLNVPSLFDAFKFVRSNVGRLGALTQLHLHGVDKTELIILLKPGTNELVAVTLTLTEFPGVESLGAVPVLMMMQLPDPKLELIGAIQEATINNPDLKSLVLKDGGANLEVVIKIPMRKVDLEGKLPTRDQITLLTRLPTACPLLQEFQMTVAPFPDLHETCRILGPKFRTLKTFTTFRLRLENGTVALIKFAKDGAIGSVALCIPEECAEERVKIPMVKKVTICPTHTYLWCDTEHMRRVLGKVLGFYPEMETLEIVGDVISPFLVLLFLQKLAKTYTWRPLRRYRHRANETSETFITHDLPLLKLRLEEYVVCEDEFLELERLIHASPSICEVAITVATGAMIDSIDKTMKGISKMYKHLEKLSIKSNDGYAIALCWRGIRLALEAEGSLISSGLGEAELQVSGTEWPLLFRQCKASKLVIVSNPLGNNGVGDGNDNNNINIHNILSRTKVECAQLRHLVLTCPINHFFGFLSDALSHPSISKFDLQDPADNRIIITTTISSGRIAGATVFLDKISDKDLLDIFCTAFAESQLRIMIDLDKSQQTEVDVSLDLVDKEGGKEVLGRIQWNTKNVSGRRVFELLDRLRARGNAEAQHAFRVIWRPPQTTVGTGIREGAREGTAQKPYSDILDNAETMATLVKLLVRRATSFDIGYETLAPLTPFVKVETEKKPLGVSGEKPFSLLRKYDIRVIKGPAESDVIQMFNLLIPRNVEHTIHDITTTYVLPSRN